MRVLVADDHSIVRAGLRRMIELEYPGAVIGEATNTRELLAQVAQCRWDVVILDISLGVDSGLAALPQIKARCPQLPVIVLSMHGERQFVVRALADGASAYLTKEQAADEELFRALNAVRAGRRYLSQAMAEQLAAYLAHDRGARPHETLSSRELEVFLHLAQGRSVSQIADQMGLSAKTVSTYRSRILEKMSLTSTAEIIQYALRNGLVA